MRKINLKELKEIVDGTIEHTHDINPENIHVLITISEPSMGGRASSAVKFAGLGFDWERGQFRIEPSDTLVYKGNSKKDVKKPRQTNIGGRTYLFCSDCNERVNKKDNFCKCCSQKLK